MPTRNVDLTEHDDSLLEASVAAGRFSDASEAVGAGLHLLERQEAEEQAKPEWLRSAAQEGIDALERGDSISPATENRIGSYALPRQLQLPG